MTRWGAANPIFGNSMGGVFGLGLGAYLSQMLVFRGRLYPASSVWAIMRAFSSWLILIARR